MRLTRATLAAVALAAAFAAPATAAENDPPIGICSYDIDWGEVPWLLSQLPAGTGNTVGNAICRI